MAPPEKKTPMTRTPSGQVDTARRRMKICIVTRNNPCRCRHLVKTRRPDGRGLIRAEIPGHWLYLHENNTQTDEALFLLLYNQVRGISFLRHGFSLISRLPRLGSLTIE
jgi:hypothetical protein